MLMPESTLLVSHNVAQCGQTSRSSSSSTSPAPAPSYMCTVKIRSHLGTYRRNQLSTQQLLVLMSMREFLRHFTWPVSWLWHELYVSTLTCSTLPQPSAILSMHAGKGREETISSLLYTCRQLLIQQEHTADGYRRECDDAVAALALAEQQMTEVCLQPRHDIMLYTTAQHAYIRSLHDYILFEAGIPPHSLWKIVCLPCVMSWRLPGFGHHQCLNSRQKPACTKFVKEETFARCPAAMLIVSRAWGRQMAPAGSSIAANGSETHLQTSALPFVILTSGSRVTA